MVPVHQIDPRDAAAFDEWFAVLHATDLERWPGRPGWQREERLARAIDDEGPEEHRCLVARDVGGPVVGVADLEMFRRENRHLARLQVYVLPGARRRGVGSALVRAAEQMTRAAGRRVLGGMDETPVREGVAESTSAFAMHHGFLPAQRILLRELALPLSAAMPEPIPGYTLETLHDRWPDADMEDRCELGRRMSTDAPVGEQELDEEVWDESRVRQIEASLSAQNRAKVITAARHDASGRIVAFTEVAVPLGAPDSAWQHDTLVMREHRGHGLGLAVKRANAVAVHGAHPGVRTVSTHNAAENEHMIAINEALGCQVTATCTYWLKKLGSSP